MNKKKKVKKKKKKEEGDERVIDLRRRRRPPNAKTKSKLVSAKSTPVATDVLVTERKKKPITCARGSTSHVQSSSLS